MRYYYRLELETLAVVVVVAELLGKYLKQYVPL